MITAALDAVPGTVSVHVARLGAAPAYTRLPDATHYAASMMKVAVLATVYRAASAGRLDLDTGVPVRDTFVSAAPGAPAFVLRPNHDSDDAVWQHLGGRAPLRWLARRMIVRSSNLAANIVLGHVGLPAVAEVWALAGATGSVTGRGIEDAAAREAGITNLVTAGDLAALLSAIALGADGGHRLAPPGTCREMLDVLAAQEYREDLPAGLPPGTRIAVKNGWVEGVRHAAGVVFPADAAPYVIAVCTTTAWAGAEHGDDAACRLITRISADAWAARAAPA